MKKFLFILLLPLGMFACDDIFETDLTEETVTVVAPTDGLEVEPGAVTFLWRGVEGARSYRLRIVEGSFSGHGRGIVDTLMHDDTTGIKRSYLRALDEGEYQWSIVALNGEYETPETIQSLYVTGVGPVDISGRQVEITAPHDGAELDAGEITFLWRELDGADSYHITIVGPSFDRATRVVADETVTERSFRTSIPAGSYQWSLQAVNDRYRTEERIFSFEVVEPEEPEER